MNVKNLLIYAAIASSLFVGNVIAEENTGDVTGEALIAQCKQQAAANSAGESDTFVSNCINEKMQYDNDE